jgi:hypothetical protein
LDRQKVPTEEPDLSWLLLDSIYWASPIIPATNMTKTNKTKTKLMNVIIIVTRTTWLPHDL